MGTPSYLPRNVPVGLAAAGCLIAPGRALRRAGRGRGRPGTAAAACVIDAAHPAVGPDGPTCSTRHQDPSGHVGEPSSRSPGGGAGRPAAGAGRQRAGWRGGGRGRAGQGQDGRGRMAKETAQCPGSPGREGPGHTPVARHGWGSQKGRARGGRARQRRCSQTAARVSPGGRRSHGGRVLRDQTETAAASVSWLAGTRRPVSRAQGPPVRLAPTPSGLPEASRGDSGCAGLGAAGGRVPGSKLVPGHTGAEAPPAASLSVWSRLQSCCPARPG